MASLYLWDKDREKFVLRAQHGWEHPEWVNAASYKTTDNWMGIKAVEPLYIENLNLFYKGQPGKGGGRYARYMFGQPLSDEDNNGD